MRALPVLVLAGAVALPSTVCGDDGGLACGGFETCAFVPGFASTFGIWGTDVMEITGAQQGITPLEGDKMLHFQCTFFLPPCNTGGTGSDAQQLVDLGPFADLVASGNAVAVATGFFNRVAGDAQTDTEFRVGLLAFSGNASDYPSQPAPLLTSSMALISDSDVLTWEPATVVLAIPASATYLAVGLSAIENVFNNEDGSPPFDGHYADAITLCIAPACVGDLNFDAVVDGADLGILLGQWGGGGSGDLTGDGVVDGADLGLLLGEWGACR